MNWHNPNNKIQSKTILHFPTCGFSKLFQSILSDWLKVRRRIVAMYYDCLANGDPS